MYILKKHATFPQKTVWITSKNVEKFSKKYVEKQIFPKSYPQTFFFLVKNASYPPYSSVHKSKKSGA